MSLRASRRLLPWLALFAAAVGVRLLAYGIVVADGRLDPPHAADEFYHLRRIWFGVVNFPATLSFDRYLNHPVGAAPIWPPVFDWSIAALARALVGPGDPRAVELVAAGVPPLLGGAAVVASAWLARRVFTPAAGWAAGLLLVALPAHVDLSAFGRVDHHVAVGLLATLLVAAAARTAGPLAPNGRASGALVLGVVAASALLLWPGALLHVLVVQAFLVVQVLVSAERTAAVGRARALAVAHAVAAALVAPSCLGRDWAGFGAWSPQVLSSFQPTWLAAGAAALALASALWSRTALGADRGRRIGSAVAVGTIGLGIAWLGLPGLAPATSDAAGWFGGDPFLGFVAETQPLLRWSDDGRGIAEAQRQFTALFWAFPAAWAAVAAWAVRRRRPDALLVVVASGVAFVALLLQARFRDVAGLGFAWILAPALSEGCRLAVRSLRLPIAFAGVAFAAVLVGASLPNLVTYRDQGRATLAVLHGARIAPGEGMRLQRGLRDVGEWMRRNTPPTRGYLDPRLHPEYGVLSAWGHGHLLRWFGERPMVQDNFGPWGGREGSDAARRFYDSREETGATAIADALGARYVVATVRGSGQGRPRAGSLAERLVPVRLPDGTLTHRGPALERLRLLLVASDGGAPERGPVRAPALYEVVPGANVRGAAAPGAEVRFELDVELPHGERFRYRAAVETASDGRYAVRLPYPSEAGYRASSGALTRPLPLSAGDVERGRSIEGPTFD